MIQLYLIRHGQTEYNKNHIFQGTTDNGLNSFGFKQAEMIADFFKKINVDEIYSSPLNRVLETAKPLSKAKNVPVKILDEFYEVDCGLWEGEKWEVLVEEHKEDLKRWLLEGDFKAPQGESLLDVYKRVEQRLFSLISSPEEDKTIVVFAHGGVNRAVICHLLGIPIDRAFRFEQENACINKFIIHHNYPPRVVFLNYTGHLKEEE